MAVRDTPQREMYLRLLAKWIADDIPTGEINRVAGKLGISGLYNYKTQLMQKQYGNVLVSPPEQKRGIVRFINNMFKRYIELRNSIYENVKTIVDEAWLKR
jgi:hypothetical protein